MSETPTAEMSLGELRQTVSSLRKEKRREDLRRTLGLDTVKDVFLNVPLSKETRFCMVMPDLDDAVRGALEPRELALLEEVACGLPMSSMLRSDTLQEEMEVHAVLQRLLSAGLIAVVG